MTSTSTERTHPTLILAVLSLGGIAYAITRSGHQLWAFTAGNSLWTTPAFAPDGSSYWGSLDFHVYRLNARGRPLWSTFVPRYVVSSPVLGAAPTAEHRGIVYVGASNGKLYAIDADTGRRR